MSEDQQPCDAYTENLAELALGILTGRDRAVTLAHVDTCAHCAEELEQLARAADAVLTVAPQLEPPVGFEVRLLSQMGVAEVPAHDVAAHPTLRRRIAGAPRAVLAVAAAVVVLAVGVAVGWSFGGSTGHGTAGQKPAGAVAAATLTSDGSPVGNVVTYGGKSPWMIVTLADSQARGTIICEVVTDDGVVHRVGAFSAANGYAAWDAPLRVAPQDVRKAEVLSSNGTVIATASLQ